MNKARKQVQEEIRGLSRVAFFELFATLVGLAVDLATVFGFLATLRNGGREPSTGGWDTSDFLVLLLVALLYSLGFANSRLHTRWQGHRSSLTPLHRTRTEEARDLQHRFAMAALTSFPVTYLYIRALIAASTLPLFPDPDMTGAGWLTLVAAIVASVLVIPVTAGIAYLFELAALGLTDARRR